MSKYKTGEIAEIYGVSGSTVQYYDMWNILNPSELFEDGRKLYTEKDAGKFRIICFLRAACF